MFEGWCRTPAQPDSQPPRPSPHPPACLPACLQGMNSKEFAAGLGYMGQEEVCHRANICLLLISHDDSGGLAQVGCGDCLAVA